MTPSNPILKVGEPFRFSCVLDKTNDKLKRYSSSDIYFDLDGRNITGPPELHVVNDTTADLIIERLVQQLRINSGPPQAFSKYEKITSGNGRNIKFFQDEPLIQIHD